MTYPGHVKNAVVIFDEPTSLPEGTEVRVEPVSSTTAGFWQSPSLDELARRQGVIFPEQDEEWIGGWPKDELNDGFEDAVARWRQLELEQGG
jgi:hypothetical protein